MIPRPILRGISRAFAAATSLSLLSGAALACSITTLSDRIAYAGHQAAVDTLVVQGRLSAHATPERIAADWMEAADIAGQGLHRGAAHQAVVTGHVITAVRGGAGQVPMQRTPGAQSAEISVVQVCRDGGCGTLSAHTWEGAEGRVFVLTRPRARMSPMRLDQGPWALAVDPCGSSVFSAPEPTG
mgnify:CR=1 FL=1